MEEKMNYRIKKFVQEFLRFAVNIFRLLFVFRYAIKRSPNHYFIFVGLDRKILYANLAARSVFGCLKGKIATSIYAYGLDAQMVAEALKNKGCFIGEVRNITKDGRIIYCRLTAYIVKSSFGKVIGTVGISEDITEHKRTEEKLVKARILSELGEFAGEIAHAERNICNMLSNRIDAIIQRAGRADSKIEISKSTLLSMQEEIYRGKRFFDDLLAYSGRGSYDMITTDPNKVLKRCIESAGFNNGVRVQTFGKSQAKVQVDLMRIHEAILNILINASQAMKSGVINAEIKDKVVQVSNNGLSPGRYVHISIADTGHGMNEETKANIFKPLFTTKKQGTGLGLSSTYGCIKRHGGYITVESEVSKGTTFHVYLPAV